MMRFCTLFDRNYLSRGLALYESLSKNSSEFHLFILCLDEFTFAYLTDLHLDKVELLPVSELEQSDRELGFCKNNRSKVEYYFTLSPCLPLYLLNKYPDLPYICSIDADLYFYDNPLKILKKFEDFSILITSHHFSPDLGSQWHETGIYNVSFQAFKNNTIGKQCLGNWRKQCIDWCFNHHDALYDRFADQKYLESWPSTYGKNLMILETPDVNLALWNVNQYQLSSKDNRIYSNDLPLVFYHFSNVKIVHRYLVQCGFYWASTHAKPVLLNKIYLPYIKKIIRYNNQIFGISTDIFFKNEEKKAFALIRRAMRDRGLLFTINPANIIFYFKFSLINDIYESSRFRFSQLKFRDMVRKGVLTYEKNKE